MATTVLLADDDDRFRALVRSVLVDDGYDVVADVGDAPSAVDLAVQHDPDVAVIDLVLPGATGLSAVRSLLSDRPSRAVIVLSALFDPAIEQEAAGLGATYLDKTGGVDALEAAIEAAVARQAGELTVDAELDEVLRARREEYEALPLDRADVDPDPVAQVRRWTAEWAEVAPRDPSSAVLATAGPDGVPGARNVLVRGLDERGCAFFTNYESRKGQHLAATGHAALLFSWVPVHRQIELVGPVEQLERAESEAYFASRPRGSQIAAWASAQSTVLPDREALESAFREVEDRFGVGEVPCPPYWGGYRLVPDTIELWQGRPSRLHDRLRYTRDAAEPTGWRLERLSP